MVIIKKTENNKCWWRCGEIGTIILCLLECKLVQLLWKNSLAVPQKVKHRVTIWSSNSTPRYIPREMKTYVSTRTCTWIFMAALFLIAKKWRKSKCPSSHEWINQMWCICTMEYFSVIKTNKVDFPGGTVVKNPPVSAGDTGSSPGPGRSYMPRSN